jgi:hypothetical protein
LGNLSPHAIAAESGSALAAAARPFPGPAGVTLIAIAAVMSASGPINATLCGAAKVRLPDGPRRRPARPVRPARLSVALPRLMPRRVLSLGYRRA